MPQLAQHLSLGFFYVSVEILGSRQKKAEALKKLTDVAVRMSEEQLVELRADIKVNLVWVMQAAFLLALVYEILRQSQN